MTASNAEVAERFLYLAETWESLAAEFDSAQIFLATMDAINSDRSEPPKAA